MIEKIFGSLIRSHIFTVLMVYGGCALLFHLTIPELVGLALISAGALNLHIQYLEAQ